MSFEFYTYKAKCVRVIDGDTVELQVPVGFNIYLREKVRIARINTPETYGVKKGSEEYQAGFGPLPPNKLRC